MKILDALTEEWMDEHTHIVELPGGEFLYYDYSKTTATRNDKERIRMRILENNLELKLDGMLCGKNVNYTESKPVLHHLLRDEAVLREVRERLAGDTKSGREDANADSSVVREAKDEIVEELVKMARFTQTFGEMRGVTGKRLKTIVNIGIGGSDLGPRMVTDALQCYSQDDRTVHFISNVDPSDTLKTFRKIDVERTLFVVVSKTFTTIETIENFKLALALTRSLMQGLYTPEEICRKQFVAVSSNVEETRKYGIEMVFKMWDFVGGRYSLWSAAGISISLFVGFENYMKMLIGAAVIDRDFHRSRVDSISGKLAINELSHISNGYNNKCIVCYDSYLELFHKYMQQAEMESNGKHGSKQMIVWGGVGTDAQHSFFQLIQQGEQKIYLEMVCPIRNISCEDASPVVLDNRDRIKYHNQLLTASCIAQTRSMLLGRESGDLHHRIHGNKPSVTILYSILSPETLGAMLAVYEHKIFVMGVYFNINSYDQFGVEWGKILLKDIVWNQDGRKSTEYDQSTEGLMKFYRK